MYNSFCRDFKTSPLISPVRRRLSWVLVPQPIFAQPDQLHCQNERSVDCDRLFKEGMHDRMQLLEDRELAVCCQSHVT